MERDTPCLLHCGLINEFQWHESSGILGEFAIDPNVKTQVVREAVMLVQLTMAVTMEHNGSVWLLIPRDHRIMAESQHKILRQERAGGRLDSQIEYLCRSLEIIGVCPYGTVVIVLYEKLLSWKLFQQMTGIFALEECEVA